MKSFQLYRSDCWRVDKGDMAKIDVFHNGCLRKICRIFWPNYISIVDLYKKTGCNNAVLEIRRRRLRWLGHVRKDSIPKSGTEMDTTWKKEARTAKDDMATEGDGRAERDGAVMG